MRFTNFEQDLCKLLQKYEFDRTTFVDAGVLAQSMSSELALREAMIQGALDFTEQLREELTG